MDGARHWQFLDQRVRVPQPCGHAVRPASVCSSCGGALEPVKLLDQPMLSRGRDAVFDYVRDRRRPLSGRVLETKQPGYEARVEASSARVFLRVSQPSRRSGVRLSSIGIEMKTKKPAMASGPAMVHSG